MVCMDPAMCERVWLMTVVVCVCRLGEEYMCVCGGGGRRGVGGGGRRDIFCCNTTCIMEFVLSSKSIY